MSDTNGANFVAGFMVGVLAGAGLALLFAPQSGEETRQKISDQGFELKGQAQEMSGKARDRAEDLTARGRTALNERVTRLGEAVSDGEKTGDKKVKELGAKFDEARAG